MVKWRHKEFSNWEYPYEQMTQRERERVKSKAETKASKVHSSSENIQNRLTLSANSEKPG